MIKNLEFISRMTLEEKVKFICTRNETIQAVSNYGFPQYGFSSFPVKSRVDVKATIFPHERAMGASGDYDLIKKCYQDMGLEAKRYTNTMLYRFDTSYKTMLFNEDQLINGKCISSAISGLKDVRMPYVLECDFVDKTSSQKTFEHNFLALELALKNNTPHAIIVNSVDEVKYINKTGLYKGAYIAKAKTIEQAIQAYNNGCCLVFLDESLENAEEYLLDAITNYHKEYIKVKNGFVSKSSFNLKVSEGKLLSFETVNTAVDNLIEFISKVTNDFNYNFVETPTSLSNTTAYFDERMHANNSKEMARNSVCLIKNNNNILPLSQAKKVCVFGHSANQKDYNLKEFVNEPTEFETFFDQVNSYDIKTTGYSYGYKDREINEELLNDAISLAKDSDYSLVFLKNYDNESYIDESQINLVKTLSDKGAKVICAVESNVVVDMSFEKYCDAILFYPNLGQYYAKALLDVLSGKFSPKGSLPFTLPCSSEVDVDYKKISPYQFLSANHIKTQFAYNYSLSYLDLEYKLIDCKDDIVTFSVKNNSNYEGFANVSLYVSSDAKNPIEHKAIRHTHSIYLKAKQSESCEIKFDEYTFRAYDGLIGSYLIRGGKYYITLENGCDNPICGYELKLSQSILQDMDKWDNISALKDDDFTFVNENITPEIENRKTKKALSIVGLIYCCGLSGILALLSLYYSLIVPALICAVVLVISLIVFIKLIIKYRKPKETKMLVKEITSDLVNMNKFYEVAKVTYQKPVEETIDDTDFTYIKEEVEEVVEEVVEDIVPVEVKEEVVEEVVEEVYEAPTEFDEKFDRYESHVITKVEAINEMYVGFVEYLESKGLIIEKRLAREIFAAIFSSNLIVLKGDDLSLVRSVVENLISYLSLDSTVTDYNNKELDEVSVYWQVDDETNKYVKRAIVDDTYKASVAPNSLFISPVVNINPNGFKEAFTPFLRFATSPKMDSYIKLTDENIKINKNLVVVLISNDDAINNLVDQQINITCKISQTEVITKEAVAPKEISYTQIQEQKFDILENYTLQEDKWKAFDDFEEYVGKQEKFKIGNKKTLLMENYIACYLSQSATDYEAVDSCLTCLLSNKISKLNLLNDVDGRSQFMETIDRLFTDEGTKRLKETLK